MAEQCNVYGTSSINPEQLGKGIRQIRKELGLPQRDFAKALGISHTLVGFYERGQLRLSLSMLLAISRMGASEWTGSSRAESLGEREVGIGGCRPLGAGPAPTPTAAPPA